MSDPSHVSPETPGPSCMQFGASRDHLEKYAGDERLRQAVAMLRSTLGEQFPIDVSVIEPGMILELCVQLTTWLAQNEPDGVAFLKIVVESLTNDLITLEQLDGRRCISCGGSLFEQPYKSVGNELNADIRKCSNCPEPSTSYLNSRLSLQRVEESHV